MIEHMNWSMLSEREREIALGAALGYTNYGIASRLEIAEKTVEKHLTSIFRKLDVKTRAQLAALTPHATGPRAEVHVPRAIASVRAYRGHEAPAVLRSRPT